MEDAIAAADGSEYPEALTSKIGDAIAAADGSEYREALTSKTLTTKMEDAIAALNGSEYREAVALSLTRHGAKRTCGVKTLPRQTHPEGCASYN